MLSPEPRFAYQITSEVRVTSLIHFRNDIIHHAVTCREKRWVDTEPGGEAENAEPGFGRVLT